MMSVGCWAWIRCPIPFDPLKAIRFLIPSRHLTSSASPLLMKMAAAAAAASSSQSQPGSKPKRHICPFCSKPARTCLCDRIQSPGLDNSVGLTILQHSLEKKHPLNSTRIVKLGFKNATVATVSDVNSEARFALSLFGKKSSVMDGTGFENLQKQGLNDSVSSRTGKARGSELLLDCEEAVINIFMGKMGLISSVNYSFTAGIQPEKLNFDDFLKSELARGMLTRGFTVTKSQRRQVSRSLGLEECEEFELTVPPGSVLLFLTENALSVEELKASNFKMKNLILLDGTWLKARRMYNENPWLRLLPHLKLDPQEASLYREVRSQPKAGCLSTLESIVYTLKALGDECSDSLDNLLEVFGSMVDDQRQCKSERLNKSME